MFLRAVGSLGALGLFFLQVAFEVLDFEPLLADVETQPSEETITNGLIRVARSTKKVVYFVEGFGQASTTAEDDPKGYSAAKLALV